jgi:hypothetical protein
MVCSGSASGSVSINDLMEIQAAFEGVENQQAVTPHRITDLSDVTEMQIGFDDVLTLASQRRAKHFPNSFKSAIVAVNESQTGFARMFQTLNNNPQITVRIFPGMPGALEWISS